MTIYGITIEMPHSGELTRSQALTVLVNTVREQEGADSRKEALSIIKKGLNYQALIIEDINYSFRGTLSY